MGETDVNKEAAQRVLLCQKPVQDSFGGKNEGLTVWDGYEEKQRGISHIEVMF